MNLPLRHSMILPCSSRSSVHWNTYLVGYLLGHGFVYRDRYRNERLFARAGERNAILFQTKDFYLNGKKSEYTLVTPIGKTYFYIYMGQNQKVGALRPRDQ